MVENLCLNVGNMQASNSSIINLNNEQKVEVLLHALDERYKAIHTIRDRVQNVCLWTLGLFVTAGGWLLQSTAVLSNSEKLLFTLTILISVIIVRLFYLGDLEKGFKTQQRIQAKIEDTLGLCKPGIFRTDEIYPKEWADAGTKKGTGKFFLHNYFLIYLGTVILITCIWIAK
jgi:hypothetical protein